MRRAVVHVALATVLAGACQALSPTGPIPPGTSFDDAIGRELARTPDLVQPRVLVRFRAGSDAAAIVADGPPERATVWIFVFGADEPYPPKASCGEAPTDLTRRHWLGHCFSGVDVWYLYGVINDPSIVALEVEFGDHVERYPVSSPGFAFRVEDTSGSPDRHGFLDANGEPVLR
jgi:hypothetical protein